jgi:hypothetical protein
MWPRQKGWGQEDREHEKQEDQEQEEDDNTPLPGLDDAFLQKTKDLKWAVYENTVLKPEESTPEAQQNELLRVYQKMLMRAHRLLGIAQGRSIRPQEYDAFPPEVRPLLRELCEWLSAFSSGKPLSMIIPYTSYLQQSLTVYPFTHRRHVGGEDDVEAQ